VRVFIRVKLEIVGFPRMEDLGPSPGATTAMTKFIEFERVGSEPTQFTGYPVGTEETEGDFHAGIITFNVNIGHPAVFEVSFPDPVFTLHTSHLSPIILATVSACCGRPSQGQACPR
jgi:hypothetical protein